MEKEERVELVKIIISAVLFALSYVPFFGKTVRLILILASYIIAGFGVLKEAAENIFHGEIFDENFLMALATAGAIAIGEYPEAAMVMILYQIGELFEDMAVEKSHDSVEKLMDLRPDYANAERNGEIYRLTPQEVEAGEIIVVRPGEKIPLDGTVIEGVSSVNTAALTGESLPRDVGAGDEVLSGCVNMTGVLRVRTASIFAESTVSRILRLVEESEENKAKTERFITKFAKIYTPSVVIAAVVLAFVPPLIDGQWTEWIHRALTFLVISCPCALVISVPLGFFAGIGGASRRGILFKGGSCLEILAKCGHIVFDKTGTITCGSFNVTSVHPQNCTEEELLDYAAHAEAYSSHPISASLRNACKNVDPARVGETEEIAGRGVRTTVDGKTVHVGNTKLMDSLNIAWKPCESGGTAVHAAVDGQYIGYIVISDEIKENAKTAVEKLRRMGIEKLTILTGDRKETAETVGRALGIDDVRSGLLPSEKVSAVEGMSKGNTVFVGDGINDAPVLKRAEVGIAMGGIGSDAAIEAADVVLMDDDPEKIAKAIEIARRTVAIVKENVAFALGFKAAILILGMLGLATMWMAVFADVGVAFLAILNSLRAMRVK